MKNFRVQGIVTFVFCGLFWSCASRIPKIEHPEEIKASQEYDQSVKVEEFKPPEPVATPTPEPKVGSSSLLKAPKPKTKKKNKKDKGEKIADMKDDPETYLQMQPELKAGWSGQSPFRVGEKVTHKVKYFKVQAGTLSLQVLPLVAVNGRKSFRFVTSIKTSSLFSSFYSVDDKVETLVDFTSLLPHTFTLNVQESAQLKEGKSFFDHKLLKAKYWETKVTEKGGKEEKKQEWDLDAHAQNVFSAAFYLRNFNWKEGDEHAFIVSDNEKNLTFKGKAIRKEHLSTDAGEFDAIVLQPELTLQGKFQPVGDIFIWLSDDDRKFVLRIESKIKIGTIISEITELDRGQD